MMTLNQVIGTRVDFNTVAEVEQHQWQGNYSADAQAFAGADRLAHKFHKAGDIKSCAAIIRSYADRGMSIPYNDESDEVVVNEWLKGMQ